MEALLDSVLDRLGVCRPASLEDIDEPLEAVE